LYKIFNSIAKEEKSSKDVTEYFEKENEEYPDNAFRTRFTSNHDENSWNGTVFERLGEAAECFAVLTCVIPGMQLFYNGQEAGLNKRLKFFEKDPIEWKDHKFRNVYKKLFHLKKINTALFNGEQDEEMIILSPSLQNKVLAFAREKDNNKIITIFNLSRPVSFKSKHEKLRGNYLNLFTGELLKLDREEHINLEPWGYKVSLLINSSSWKNTIHNFSEEKFRIEILKKLFHVPSNTALIKLLLISI
jgi:glycosidase